jgi:exosome complex RNA-binding protein Csl4
VAKNPTDVTGRKRDELAAANAEALQERANEMSLATAEAKVKLETEVLDATKPNRAAVVVDTVTKVGVQDDVVEIRVVADVENMTLGAGNNYSFKAGQKYSVTKAVAAHLKEKGYLAGVI